MSFLCKQENKTQIIDDLQKTVEQLTIQNEKLLLEIQEHTDKKDELLEAIAKADFLKSERAKLIKTNRELLQELKSKNEEIAMLKSLST